MELTALTGTGNPHLAQTIAKHLGLRLGAVQLERFPDGELHVEVLESLRGHDVYLVQPTSAPVGEHLLELLLMADACQRAGATRLTAIIPYFGYARQDRRARGREPVGARVVANMLSTSGIERLVAVDLHTSALEGFFSIPLEHLSAVPLLADAVRPHVPSNAVVISPDLGAVKLAERYANILNLPTATVHKTRVTGEEVRVHRIVGDVNGKAPIVVDDMISTGGTIEAAVRALLTAGAIPDVAVVASHALLVGTAVERLKALPLRRLIVTDSVALPQGAPLPLEIVGLGHLLAEVVSDLHSDRSLGDLILHV